MNPVYALPIIQLLRTLSILLLFHPFFLDYLLEYFKANPNHSFLPVNYFGICLNDSGCLLVLNVTAVCLNSCLGLVFLVLTPLSCCLLVVPFSQISEPFSGQLSFSLVGSDTSAYLA